jgi:hypothetical protein
LAKSVKVTRRLKEALADFVRRPTLVSPAVRSELTAAGLVGPEGVTEAGKRLAAEVRAAIEAKKEG